MGFHDSLLLKKNGQGPPVEGNIVRFAIAAFFALGLAAPAKAEEINLLSPPMITNAGLKEINAAYTGKTGVTFKIAGAEITKLTDAIKTTNPPPDIVFMPTDMMTRLEAAGGLKAGERVHLGRMQIGLAVAKGAPHPDISTVAKLAAVLRAARMVVYTDPSNGSLQARMIDSLLKRPEFAGVHKEVSSKGNGIAALARGDGDMALQLVCEILDRPETELVGPLPAELNASIDADAAVLSGAPHPAEAAAYLKHITQPDAVAIWASKGLVRQ
jgi:molybdate transport system substrate-binding protein